MNEHLGIEQAARQDEWRAQGEDLELRCISAQHSHHSWIHTLFPEQVKWLPLSKISGNECHDASRWRFIGSASAVHHPGRHEGHVGWAARFAKLCEPMQEVRTPYLQCNPGSRCTMCPLWQCFCGQGADHAD